jgi:hypothetical protein
LVSKKQDSSSAIPVNSMLCHGRSAAMACGMPDAGKANTTLRVSTVLTSGGEHSSTCELPTLFKPLMKQK